MTSDPLARIAPVAAPVVAAVDRALATLGAPADHPVWTVLRQVGATVGDAVDGVLGLDPPALRATARALRDQARAYDAVSWPDAGSWQGDAAEAYRDHLQALAVRLAGAGPSMITTLTATATYLDAVADWAAQARTDMARALGEALTSAQIGRIRLHGDGPPGAPEIVAAADIAAHVLEAVAGVIADGEALHVAWAARLDPLDPLIPAGPRGSTRPNGTAAAGVLQVGP